MNDPIWLIIGVLVGILIGWFIARKVWTEPVESREDAAILRQRVSELEARNLELQNTQNRDAQRMATVQDQLNAAESSASSMTSQQARDTSSARGGAMSAASGAAAGSMAGSASSSDTAGTLGSGSMGGSASGAGSARTYDESDTMGSDQMRSDQMRSDQMRSDTMGSGSTGSGAMGSSSMSSSTSRSSAMGSDAVSSDTTGAGARESNTRENVASGSAYTNRDIAADLQRSDSVGELQDKEEDMGFDAESLPTQDTPGADIGDSTMRPATTVEGPGFTMHEVADDETTYTESSVSGSREFAMGDAGPGGTGPGATDDLTAIKGIGPVIARRLNEAGIYTFDALAQLSATDLRDAIGDVISTLADEEKILVEARRLSNNPEQQG